MTSEPEGTLRSGSLIVRVSVVLGRTVSTTLADVFDIVREMTLKLTFAQMKLCMCVSCIILAAMYASFACNFCRQGAEI